MGKTLVIAEKPSVGRDLTKALPGAFAKHEGYLESDTHVVTWAVGHLVQLAEPDEYDAKYKKWRMADLPIVPDRFKLVVRDERSRKQMTVITRMLKRDDVDEVINACDAGREGELIFAWTFEKAGAKKPVRRLWLSSMTSAAIRSAFGALRPASEFELLEQAARSRSEADWIVGMNATRAATIRLRSSFDGAVSLGRVQTPTLAIIARREEEIRAFVPEPYWLVDATFETVDDPRNYDGRYHAGSQPRLASAEEASAIVEAVRGGSGTITKLEKTKRSEKAPLLYDLTSLQREANTRFGFSARRTLAAAQRLYEEHKLLTYPRTNSRFLPSDMIGEIKPIASSGGDARGVRAGRGLRHGVGRPAAGACDQRRQGHRPPRDHPHQLRSSGWTSSPTTTGASTTWSSGAFWPSSIRTRCSRTRGSRRPSSDHVFRTTGRVLLEAGWRGVYGEGLEERASDSDEGAAQSLPRLAQGEDVSVLEVASEEKITQPPRRYSDASLLGAMETAGKLVDDDELREAMKDSGIGTPATRAAIIERLIDVGYVERDGRSLVATEKGLGVVRLLDDHALTSPSLTGDWEQRLGRIEQGSEARERFMADIAEFAGATVTTLDEKLKEVRIPRANLGPCPVCGHDIVENRKGFSCWSREDPGCGFVIWKNKAGKTLAPAVARELIARGRTEKAVTGFKGRSGRSFRARLALLQTDEGRWRVEFDEPWAREGAKPPEGDDAAAAAAVSSQSEAA